MEIPLSESSGAPEPGPSASGKRAGAGAHRVGSASLRFVERVLLPALEKEKHRALSVALQKAVKERDFTTVERLPERLRRDLLEVLERRVERRRGPRPDVLVELTTVFSAIAARAAPETPVPAR
jgi:hypothetical protein